MRRISAAWLLGMICFWLIAPALPATGANHLPACCRPGGKHHCAMPESGVSDSGGGSGFHAARETCPFAPFLATAPVANTVALVPERRSITPPAPVRPVREIVIEARYRGLFHRPDDGRAPPPSLV